MLTVTVSTLGLVGAALGFSFILAYTTYVTYISMKVSEIDRRKLEEDSILEKIAEEHKLTIDQIRCTISLNKGEN